MTGGCGFGAVGGLLKSVNVSRHDECGILGRRQPATQSLKAETQLFAKKKIYIYINMYMHGCNLLGGENKTHTHTQKEAIVKLLQISSTNQNKSDENFNLSLDTFTSNDSS